MRQLIAGTAASLLLLFGAVNASAATRYVEADGSDTTFCTDPAEPCATVVFAAENAADGDTIQIGPGEFFGSVYVSGKALTFVGSGPTTVIRGDIGPPDFQGFPGIALNASGAIRSLRVVGGTGGMGLEPEGGGGGRAILIENANPAEVEIEEVEAIGGAGGEGGIPGSSGLALLASGSQPLKIIARASSFAEMPGSWAGSGAVVVHTNADATFTGSTFTGGENGGGGLTVSGGGVARVSESSFDASYGVQVTGGELLLSRSRIAATQEGVLLESAASRPVFAEIFDSLVTAPRTAVSLFSGGFEGRDAALSVRGSTLIGSDTTVISAVSQGPEFGPVSVDLRNTIARFIPTADETPSDLFALGATITAEHSAFSHSTALSGGSVPAPGSGTNLDVDPLFVDAAAGNFALLPGSPLIDRGNPAFVAPGELDLAGARRSLDGNRDCVAAPDVGAFELTGHECVRADPLADAVPTVTGFSLSNRKFAPQGAAKERRGKGARSSAKRKRSAKRGTKFRYTLSEPARVTITIERRHEVICPRPRPGARKRHCLRWSKTGTLTADAKSGRQATKFSGRLRGKPLKPGRYRATIVATDAAGQASAPRRAGFQVVRG